MPSSLLLGLAAGFASIIPVVGSAIVWAPVSIYLLVSGAIWKGVFLLLWSAIVISNIDNVLRPMVVAGRVELHPMVLLFFIFGGVEAFGFLGLFLGPVVASILAAVFRMLRKIRGRPRSRVPSQGHRDPRRGGQHRGRRYAQPLARRPGHPPAIVGYQAGGEIVEVGSEVTNLRSARRSPPPAPVPR